MHFFSINYSLFRLCITGGVNNNPQTFDNDRNDYLIRSLLESLKGFITYPFLGSLCSASVLCALSVCLTCLLTYLSLFTVFCILRSPTAHSHRLGIVQYSFNVLLILSLGIQKLKNHFEKTWKWCVHNDERFILNNKVSSCMTKCLD